MEMVDVTKDAILYSEKDNIDYIYFVINGSFEYSKLIKTYVKNGDAELKYTPLAPNDTFKAKYVTFIKEFCNIFAQFEQNEISEFEKFKQKPIQDFLRLIISTENDVIGLEELMLGEEKRVFKVQCSSETGKVVRFSIKKLFKKLTDQGTLKIPTSTYKLTLP